MWRFLNSIIQTFWTYVFPDKCVGCGKGNELLCIECLKKIPRANISPYSFVSSIFSYQDFRIKKLIWLLKYRNAKRVANIFAEDLAKEILNFLKAKNISQILQKSEKIYLVPIPIDVRRLRQRGYNQTQLLAEEGRNFLKENSAQTSASNPELILQTELIFKIHKTKPQAETKNRTERLNNLKDCFEVQLKEPIAKDSIIILIDDVLTTGATVLSAKSAFEKLGFKNVFAITLAH